MPLLGIDYLRRFFLTFPPLSDCSMTQSPVMCTRDRNAGSNFYRDVVMANLNGFWALWVSDGVVPEKSMVSFVALTWGLGRPVF